MRCVCDWLLVVRLVGSRGRRADAVGDGEWDGLGGVGCPIVAEYLLTHLREWDSLGGRGAGVFAEGDRPL